MQEVSGFGAVKDRRKALLGLLAERTQVTVKEASEALGVSEVTTRMDFAALEREGQLQRVWGGAILPEPGRAEATFLSRLALQQAEKRAIATAAAELVEDGDTILLDASTTAYAIAQRLKETKRDLYIITNGLHTALELASNPGFTVVVSGGIVRSGYGSLVGTLGEEVLERLYAAKAFFSAQGINLRQGLAESTIQEGQLKGIMVEHAQQIIAVVDSTKLGRTSFTSFCPFERVNLLITSGKNAGELVAPFIQRGLEVKVV